jgi:aminoglycoside/choline kinase family phosphotransferase
MFESRNERDDLTRWLVAAGIVRAAADVVIEPLAGDVSPRRYYRVRAGAERAVVAYYPPELREIARRFLRTTDLLAGAGVRVPVVRRFDDEAGLMLLEDVGAVTLFDWRDREWEALAPWLEAAVDAARRVARIDPAALSGLLPPLDAAVLERELVSTWDLFLAPNGLVGEPALARRLRARLEALCVELEADGLVPCHRDFMVRNLVPVDGAGELVVLDHQDLRLGPRAYDLASLFNDSLFAPAAVVRSLLGEEAVHDHAYHRAVVQRTLKIVGTFASFAQRGHPRYLPLVPAALARGLDHLAALPDAAALASDLARAWAGVLPHENALLD